MCSPYVPLTNRISSISVPFPNGLGNWPAEERKLIQVSMMLKIIVCFFLPCSQSTPNFIVTCFSGVQRTLSHFVRGAFLYRRGIGVTWSGHCDARIWECEMGSLCMEKRSVSWVFAGWEVVSYPAYFSHAEAGHETSWGVLGSLRPSKLDRLFSAMAILLLHTGEAKFTAIHVALRHLIKDSWWG